MFYPRVRSPSFRKKHGIKKILADNESDFSQESDKHLLATIREGLQGSEDTFTQLTALPILDPTATASAGLSEKYARLQSRLSVEAQNTIAATKTLADTSTARAANTLTKIIFLFSTAGAIFSLLLLFSFWIIWRSAIKMQEGDERFSFVSKATRDAIYDWNIPKNTIWFGEGMQKIFGYKPEQILPTTDWWTSHIHPDDLARINQEIEVTLDGEQDTVRLEYRFRRADDSYAAVVDMAYIIRNKLGKAVRYFGVMQDLTKEKEVDRMKTEFISLASHQLRTPLTAMKWYTEMLMAGDNGVLNPEVKKSVQVIAESNQRMVELVNALLDISRIESGRIMIEPKPTDLKELVSSILQEVRPRSEAKHQEIVVNIPTDLPQISIDPQMIRQVYVNFLTNAIKYTPEKGKISITITKNQKDIISQIADTGYGIPIQQQDRVFQKFFRAENITRVEIDGTGLGLYLVKAIVEASGGRTGFESTEGKGSTFWFALPLAGSIKKEGEVRIGA